MTTVINLFGGPGIGKSTVAAGLLYNLKSMGKSTELVSEYAKDVTYEGSHALLENQLHIFAEQCRRQYRLVDKVDFIVTDSPLILSNVYLDWYQNKEKTSFKLKPDYLDQMKDFFYATWTQFENRSFLLTRDVQYDKLGRNETEEEAKKIDGNIKELLNSHYVFYETVNPFTGVIDIIQKLELE